MNDASGRFFASLLPFPLSEGVTPVDGALLQPLVVHVGVAPFSGGRVAEGGVGPKMIPVPGLTSSCL